jgi:Ni/Co efflux regulator RcnB
MTKTILIALSTVFTLLSFPAARATDSGMRQDTQEVRHDRHAVHHSRKVHRHHHHHHHVHHVQHVDHDRR